MPSEVCDPRGARAVDDAVSPAASPAAHRVGPLVDCPVYVSVEGVLQTPDVRLIAAALAKFQGATTGALKGGTAEAGTRRRSYTRLEDAWEAARGPLTAHGLSVMQWPMAQPGSVTVVTRVLHESGQWLQSSLTLAVDKGGHMNATQQYGSAITYACRYSFLAALGLPPVDDDGEGAGERPAQKQARATRVQRPSPQPCAVDEPMPAWSADAEPEAPKTARDPQEPPAVGPTAEATRIGGILRASDSVETMRISMREESLTERKAQDHPLALSAAEQRYVGSIVKWLTATLPAEPVAEECPL